MFARTITIEMADWYKYRMDYPYRFFMSKDFDWNDTTLLSQFKKMITEVDKIENKRNLSWYIKIWR